MNTVLPTPPLALPLALPMALAPATSVTFSLTEPQPAVRDGVDLAAFRQSSNPGIGGSDAGDRSQLGALRYPVRRRPRGGAAGARRQLTAKARNAGAGGDAGPCFMG